MSLYGNVRLTIVQRQIKIWKTIFIKQMNHLFSFVTPCSITFSSAGFGTVSERFQRILVPLFSSSYIVIRVDIQNLVISIFFMPNTKILYDPADPPWSHAEVAHNTTKIPKLVHKREEVFSLIKLLSVFRFVMCYLCSRPTT